MRPRRETLFGVDEPVFGEVPPRALARQQAGLQLDQAGLFDLTGAM
jgi:hypothetical protein